MFTQGIKEGAGKKNFRRCECTHTHSYSFRTIAKFFKVNVHSAFVWVQTFAKNNYSKPALIDDSVIIELDGNVAFLMPQKRQVWIWKAYCRTPKQLIAWECGARGAETFRKMYELLKKWNVNVFFSDCYRVYRDFIPSKCLKVSQKAQL